MAPFKGHGWVHSFGTSCMTYWWRKGRRRSLTNLQEITRAKEAIRKDGRRRLVEKWQTRWHGDQTERWTHRLIPELASWLDRKHGQVGFYLAQALSGHGCFNAYMKRFKKRDGESCRYCGSLVENAELLHTLCLCCDRYECLTSHWSPWLWRRGSSMGVQSAATTRASRNRSGACTRVPASRVDLAVRFDRGRNLFLPPLVGTAIWLAWRARFRGWESWANGWRKSRSRF